MKTPEKSWYSVQAVTSTAWATGIFRVHLADWPRSWQHHHSCKTYRMKRTILKVLAPSYSGKCELLQCFPNGSNPHSCAMINCNLSNEKELLQVFENPIANLCAFQLLMQRCSLENYVNALGKKWEHFHYRSYTIRSSEVAHNSLYSNPFHIELFIRIVWWRNMRSCSKNVLPWKVICSVMLLTFTWISVRRNALKTWNIIHQENLYWKSPCCTIYFTTSIYTVTWILQRNLSSTWRRK